MGLNQGTLKSLMEGDISIPINELAEAVLHQMLQAIDYLATEGIIHRDLKPENILYVSQENHYHFKLGDFGLCNCANIAETFAGSLLYMAPEMFQMRQQTHKVDVWSLFVTVLWTLDVGEFRRLSDSVRSIKGCQRAILSAASTGKVSSIQEMARINPEERASAAQMLLKCFAGGGTHDSAASGSTSRRFRKGQRHQRPRLGSSCARSRPKPRGTQKHMNPVSQFGVKTARPPL